ncbi:type IV pilus modification protein PilV [Kaarinaea lacus]
MYNSFKPIQQKGFSIIEVLISVLVISIGLLGMAGLQTTGIQQSHNSYLKTQASMLAYDMADRMRSNLQGVAAGHYNSINNGTLDLITSEPVCADTNACTAEEIASIDIYQWTSADTTGSISAALPSGHGMVSNNGGVFTISVLWDENRTGQTGTDCAGDPAANLKCFQLEFIP